jgi:hypothetical protein
MHLWIRIGLTPRYFEWEVQHGDLFEFYYVVPVDESSIVYAVCWKRAFDVLMMKVDNPSFRKKMQRSWPTLDRLIERAQLRQMNDACALVRMNDFDSGEPNWFVVCRVDNVDPWSPKSWGPVSADAEMWARQGSRMLLEELATSEFADAPPIVYDDIWRAFHESLAAVLDSPWSGKGSPAPRSFSQTAGEGAPLRKSYGQPAGLGDVRQSVAAWAGVVGRGGEACRKARLRRLQQT